MKLGEMRPNYRSVIAQNSARRIVLTGHPKNNNKCYSHINKYLILFSSLTKWEIRKGNKYAFLKSDVRF